MHYGTAANWIWVQMSLATIVQMSLATIVQMSLATIVQMSLATIVQMSLATIVPWKESQPLQLLKVTQCHFMPGPALRVPVGWGSHISRQSAHEGGKVLSTTHRPPLPSRKYCWYPLLLEAVNPRAIVLTGGLWQWKFPLTPSWIEPATFWLEAQYLQLLYYCILE